METEIVDIMTFWSRLYVSLKTHNIVKFILGLQVLFILLFVHQV